MKQEVTEGSVNDLMTGYWTFTLASSNMAIDFYPKPRSFFSSESQPRIRALLQIWYGRRAVAKHEAKAEWAENSCERGHEQLPIFDIAKNKTEHLRG